MDQAPYPAFDTTANPLQIFRVEPNGSLFAMMNLLVHTIMYDRIASITEKI